MHEQTENSASSSQNFSIQFDKTLPSLHIHSVPKVPGKLKLAPNYRKGSLNSCYNSIDIIEVTPFTSKANHTQLFRKQAQ